MQRLLLFPVVLGLLFVLNACDRSAPLNPDLNGLHDILTGHFTAIDSTGTPVDLTIFRLPAENPDELWLAMRQSSSGEGVHLNWLLVLRIVAESDGFFIGQAFSPADSSQRADLKNLLPSSRVPEVESLRLRPSMSARLRLRATGGRCFSGGLHGIIDIEEMEQAGASYTTSSWSLTADTLNIKDQAWDEEDQLIWGPRDPGFVFVRNDHTK